jgi:acyl dehydratase
MTEGAEGPLTIDTSGLGRHTIARTELLDLPRVLGFAAGIHEESAVYHDDVREGGPAVHPGIAFALEFGAQGRLGVVTGSDAAWLGAVHAETDLRIHVPFRVGQVVTTQGQVVARRQLRSGVYNCERYRMVDDQGVLLAEMDFVIIVRGAMLKGGDVDLSPIPPRPEPVIGDIVLLLERAVPRSLLHHFTACSGIHAAIHSVPQMARAAGFPDIILHGSATKSIAISAIVERYFGGDPTRMTRLYGQLRHVIPAETHFRIEVTGISEVDGQRHVFFRVLNAAGQPAIANGLISGRVA